MMWQTSSESVILEWSRSDNNLKNSSSVCKSCHCRCHDKNHCQSCHKTSNRKTNGAASSIMSNGKKERVKKDLETDCRRKSVVFETREYNKTGRPPQLHKSTRRNSVEKMDKIRALFEETPASDDRVFKMGRTHSAVVGSKRVKHHQSRARPKNFVTEQKSQRDNDKFANGGTDGCVQSNSAGIKQNASSQPSCKIKNKLKIPRARSAFEGGRDNKTQQLLHSGAYQTRSMPGMPQTQHRTQQSTTLEDTTNSSSHTVANSQMKFWHLRKIIRDTLVRYGDIGENECSKELDEAISSYAIHYMLKPTTFKTDLESSSAKISGGSVLSDDVQHSNENANIKQNQMLHHGQAPVSETNKSGGSPDMSITIPCYKSNMDLSRRIDLLLGRKGEGHKGQLHENGESPESPQKVLTQDNQLHQGHDTHLQNNVYQLVDKCFLLVTETQHNLTNMENLIDNLHKVIDTSHNKVEDGVRTQNAKSVEKYLQKCDTGLRIPLSHATTAPSSCSLNSGQISPYPRIYPMISIQGDAGDAIAIATSEAGNGHSKVDASSMVLENSQDPVGIEQMSLPQVDVSLDHEDMWKQVVEKSKINSHPECRISKLKCNQLDNKDISKNKLHTCITNPYKENKSVDNNDRLSKASSMSTDTTESDQENMVSSPPSYEGLLTTFYEKERSQHIFNETQTGTCGRKHQPNLDLPENTVEKLDYVLSNLDKMLHELAEIIDLMVYGDFHTEGIQDQGIQNCASSSVQSMLSKTSSKDNKLVKSSKYDMLMDRLSQGLQKIFTSKHKLKSSSAEEAISHSLSASDGTQDLANNNFEGNGVFVV